MTTRDRVDPELLAALEVFPLLDLTDATLPQIRAGMAEVAMPLADCAREAIAVERRTVPGWEGAPDVPVIVYRPVAQDAAIPVFLHIHGGGYVLGDAAGSGPSNVRTADELGCIVVSVDYRLAPETRAPGSVEDCYAVLRWLHDEADALGIDRDRIAVGGESAGGGLAATLTLLARDRGEVAICFQMLIYPMLDDRTVAPDAAIGDDVGEFVWTRQANHFGWGALLGVAPGADEVPPYAAAARTSDLSRLPPAYISVGALDLFLDEDVAYARRLLAAGVPTELHVWPGAFHGFEVGASAGVSQRAESERRAALARAFARTIS